MEKFNCINNHFKSTLFDNQCNGPCIILGSGKSLEQLNLCPQWKNYYSISCNWSQLYFPSQITTWQDAEFISGSQRVLKRYQYLTCSILPTSKNALYNKSLMIGLGGIYINRKIYPNGDPHWIESKNSKSIPSCSPITGVISIALAYIMGFNPIIIIGFDCKIGEYKYYKKHPKYGFNNSRGANVHAKTQEKFLKNFHKKLNIINCSYYDKITQIKLHNALSQLGNNNRKENIQIIKDTYIKQCKKQGLPFINQWIDRKEVT